MSKQRVDGRGPEELRPVSFELGIAPHAAGSVLVRCGNTWVICAVTVQEEVPRWMKDQGVSGGWITAEYNMLPYSTLERKPRDAARGKPDGRSVEIQRFLGRALRAVVDLEKLGPRQLTVDCDVLRADGGTRTTAITGAYVALQLAARSLLASGRCRENPIVAQVAAVSVGIVGGEILLDLPYLEDKDAEVDMNVAMTKEGKLVEVQAGGEEATFSRAQFEELLRVAEIGASRLFALQDAALLAL